MLDSKILDRSERLIKIALDNRQKKLPTEIARMKGKLNATGNLHSSHCLQSIHRICAEEVVTRSGIVLDSIKRAHKAVGSPHAETLAADIKEQCNDYIERFTEKIGEIMSRELLFMERDAKRYNLSEAKDRATKEMDVEVDLYVDSLAVAAKDIDPVISETPTIFISHAAEDAALARAIKTQLDNVFEKKINIFVSSITISPGSDWFDKILDSLTENDAFVVLVTPYSEKRPFVWFEIGFSWLRRHNNKCDIYAICAPPINPGKLPEPLCRLQAISLADEEKTLSFFEKLTKQFKLGNSDALEFAKIQESLPTYPSQITQSEYKDISDEAKALLFEASEDTKGDIIKILFGNGTTKGIQIGSKDMVPSQNSRIIAKWDHALKELLENDLVDSKVGKGVFAITHKGYEYADMLKKGEFPSVYEKRGILVI